MTFAQARKEAEKGLRTVRAIYRQADSQGEVVERGLDRLIEKRKKIVTSSQLLPLIERWREYKKKVDNMERALIIATKLLSSLEL